MIFEEQTMHLSRKTGNLLDNEGDDTRPVRKIAFLTFCLDGESRFLPVTHIPSDNLQ